MRNLSATLAVLITLLFLSNLTSAQNIVLTFTGQEEGTSNHVATDSIFIRNVTQGGDTMLIGNDTVLELYYTGISESSIESSDFELTQNYPNPFSDKTTFVIRVYQEEELTIRASNMLGQKLAEYSGVYQSGLHLFKFSGGQSAFNIITVSNGSMVKSIKMVSISRSDAARHNLSYIGYQPGEKLKDKSIHTLKTEAKGGFVFNLGDELQYAGYSNGYEISAIYDHPEVSTDHVFTFEFPDTFVCGDLYTDERDGETYETVEIGHQCWMTENMNIGNLIPGGEDQQDDGDYEKYCYDDNEANCDEFGGLYQWSEMMQYDTIRFNQGICPEGWHLPTSDEWNKLIDYYGGPTVAGDSLKPDGISGFEALMSGYRNMSGQFSKLNNEGYYWASVAKNNSQSYYYSLAQFNTGIGSGSIDNGFGYAVRCLKGLSIKRDSNVVIIDSLVYTLISDSVMLSQGIYQYEYNKKRKADDIVIGDAIIGITDEGYLRKVNTVDDDPPYLTLETSQATMEDVFIQGDFSTPFNLDSLEQLKTLYSGGNITYLRDGVDIIILNNGFEYTFDNVQIFDNGNISFYITQGGVIFDPEFEFDFKFKNGIVQRLAFYSDESLLENSIDVELVAQYAESLQDEITLASYQHHILFVIGVVPVWIVVNLDLKAVSDISIDANFQATTGYTNTNYVTVGLEYENGEWNSLWDLQQDNNLHPVDYSGSFNLAQHLSLIPSISVKLYSVAGPYVNMDLWEEFVFNYIVPSLDVDAAMDIGLDVNLGAEATILGYTLGSYNYNINAFDFNIWTMPDELQMISGNNQTAQVNQILPDPVKVKVVDNYGNTFSNIPVHFEITEGGGSISDDNVMTDVNGYAETTWTMGPNPGENKLTASVQKADGTHITGSPMEFTATTAGNAPVAEFIGNPTNGPAPLIVNFTDQSTNNPTSWSWDFGDGNTSTEQNPSHTYTVEDTYTVSLTATNSYGSDTETKSDYITVNPGGNAPVTDFIGSPTSGPAPLIVNFTDQSTNSPTSWSWDFGDGNTSTEQNPSHTYTVEDTYTVSLTATNSYGSDTETKSDYITVLGGGGQPCPGTPTVAYQGQTYNTVEIGTQCWMKENLNYATGNSWCYGDDPANCNTYGRLYDWPTLMNGSASSNTVPSGVQGICPNGWHVPSDAEWCIVTTFIDPTVDCNVTGYSGTDAGIKMKSISGWNNNGNGTNSSGYSALPGGSRDDYGGGFYYLGSRAPFWSSTEDYADYAWIRDLFDNDSEVYRLSIDEYNGNSVRCVQD